MPHSSGKVLMEYESGICPNLINGLISFRHISLPLIWLVLEGAGGGFGNKLLHDIIFESYWHYAYLTCREGFDGVCEWDFSGLVICPIQASLPLRSKQTV
ncbi:hypothetical protein CMV_026623 [Castanea mollissima]|uniref:Uncharacterized protein n=1 Tax=Castanea mollissima TaxID=60419 RepID=A0A8J4QLF5_9ROSI|nr:hypothetical protein CMV_026623 [Castanea mollissima]